MKIGPKMAFILRVYQMTEAENAEDIEHVREMVRAGLMSERDYDKRRCTRDVARKVRHRDDLSNWPRDVNTKPKARERILGDDELRKVWKVADGEFYPFGALIQLLLLTGARKSEVAGMRWAEIDGEGNWTLPAARHKLKTDLTRPLSKAARELIARLPKIDGCEFLFSGDGTGALGHLSDRKERLAKSSDTKGWTIHDLRRTARSLMSRAGVPVDHAERCVGHVIGGMRGVYDQHKYEAEMRDGFELLATQIKLIVNRQRGRGHGLCASDIAHTVRTTDPRPRCNSILV